MTQEEQHAQRLSARAWLGLIETLKTQIQDVSDELIRLSKMTPYHAWLTSLKGISDLLAALFIAELRDPAQVRHRKQIEPLAGLNLYVHDSGTYKGRRRISHIGNARLRWVLFTMASETSKYVPEVRCKYLRRRLKGQTNRNKNLVATIPNVLALLMALIQEERAYQERPEASAGAARSWARYVRTWQTRVSTRLRNGKTIEETEMKSKKSRAALLTSSK